jgi:hypothetical protein
MVTADYVGHRSIVQLVSDIFKGKEVLCLMERSYLVTVTLYSSPCVSVVFFICF